MPIQVISGIFCDTVFRGFGIDKRAHWPHQRVETSRKRQRPEPAPSPPFAVLLPSPLGRGAGGEGSRPSVPATPGATKSSTGVTPKTTAFAKPQTVPPEPPQLGNVEKKDLNVCHCWLVQQCNSKRARDPIPPVTLEIGTWPELTIFEVLPGLPKRPVSLQ